MAARRLLGIVFTPSWLRVAQAELFRGSVYLVSLHAASLPVGCIHDNSGILENYGVLYDLLQSIPLTSLHSRRGVEISLVIPQPLCFRVAFSVPTGLEHAPIEEIIAAYPIDLPGDPASLVVDSCAHSVGVKGARSVMVMAARRSSIESYARLFKDREWCLNSITTGEVARYNRWRLQYPAINSQVALICSLDANSYEFSLWDRGVLLASDTRYWSQHERSHRDVVTQEEKDSDVASDQIAREIIKMIERARSTTKPVELILLGGELRHYSSLCESLYQSTGIPCAKAAPVERYMMITKETVDGGSVGINGVQEIGLFDDALGAIAPRIFARHTSKSGVKYDYDQSDA